MNPAHYHLLVNHFPIVGLFFGIGILIFGLFKKNILVLHIAYIIFIFCVISGKISMMTGDKAEHFVENNSVFSHELIEAHEKEAENFMKVMYVLGVLSIVAIYLNSKKNKKSSLVSYAVLITSIMGIMVAKPVGTSGGEIRHTEIRSSNATITNDLEIEKNENHK